MHHWFLLPATACTYRREIEACLQIIDRANGETFRPQTHTIADPQMHLRLPTGSFIALPKRLAPVRQYFSCGTDAICGIHGFKWICQ